MLILGWALLSSPLVLLPLGLAAVFLDAKRRREEAWLVEKDVWIMGGASIARQALEAKLLDEDPDSPDSGHPGERDSALRRP